MKLFRHKLLIGGVAVAMAASAGGAYAATQSSTNPQQAYLNDVAKRLHVSPAQLNSALKGAMIDRLNAMVKAGKLTQAQANRLEQRIDKRGRVPLFFGARGRMHMFLRGSATGSLRAAATYLGLSTTQLMNDLGSGQSLAQIATKQGKSVSGLEQALLTAAQAQLHGLVTKGVITSAQEQRLLSRLSARIDKLVNRTGLKGLGPRFGRNWGGAPAFGPAGPPPPSGASAPGQPMFGSPPPTT